MFHIQFVHVCTNEFNAAVFEIAHEMGMNFHYIYRAG